MKTSKEILVDEIIQSLTDDWRAWTFDGYHAINDKAGIKLWIANAAILDLHICKPANISFSLIDKFRVYSALNDCKSKNALHLLQSVKN